MNGVFFSFFQLLDLIIQRTLWNNQEGLGDHSPDPLQAKTVRQVSRHWNQAVISSFTRAGKPLLTLRPTATPANSTEWNKANLEKLKSLVKSWKRTNPSLPIPPFSLYLPSHLFHSKKCVLLFEKLFHFGHASLFELTLSHTATWHFGEIQLPSLPKTLQSLQVITLQFEVSFFDIYPLNTFLTNLLSKSPYLSHFPSKWNWNFSYLPPQGYTSILLNLSSPPLYLIPPSQSPFARLHFPVYYLFEQWHNEHQYTIGAMLDRNLSESLVPIHASRNLGNVTVSSTTFPVSLSRVAWIIARLQTQQHSDPLPIQILNVVLSEPEAVPRQRCPPAAVTIPAPISPGVVYSLLSQMQLKVEEHKLEEILAGIFQGWKELVSIKLEICPSSLPVSMENRQQALEMSLIGARSIEEVEMLSKCSRSRDQFLLEADRQHYLLGQWDEYPAGIRNLQKLETFSVESGQNAFVISEVCVSMGFCHMPGMKRVRVGSNVRLQPKAREMLNNADIAFNEKSS